MHFLNAKAVVSPPRPNNMWAGRGAVRGRREGERKRVRGWRREGEGGVSGGEEGDGREEAGTMNNHSGEGYANREQRAPL